MSVGATLSATDPVTILAIFNTYKVEPKLYTVIFGESILNDAIAIVLFETAQKYKAGGAAEALSILSLFEAIGIFFGVFFGSLAIGLLVGIGASLLLKFTHVRRFPKTESCLIILIAYATYFFSNAIHMSGEHCKSIPVLLNADTLYRHRVAFILRYLYEALCIPQHVTEDPVDYQVRLPGHSAALREFHLHLSRSILVHRLETRV